MRAKCCGSTGSFRTEPCLAADAGPFEQNEHDRRQPGRCGWLKEKFGLSWQVIPTTLGDLLKGRKDAQMAVLAGDLELEPMDLDLIGKLAPLFS